MNIQNHIKNLLYRHDCVIVNGLGGFVCQRQSAQLKDGYFLPPKKVLSFNASLTKSDGLLANHIAKAEKVSFQIAQQKIKTFSKKINNSLEEEQKIHLKDLGYFSLNKESKLVFEPYSQINWLAEAYGLPKFKVSKIKSEKHKTVPALTPVDSKPKTLTHNNSKTNYWKYAAAGIIALGVAGLLSYQVLKKDVKTHNIAEQQKANELVNQKIQQSSFLIDKPLKTLSVEVKTPKKNPGKYHIVGGAFRVKANVEKKIKQLQQQGFDAKYIGTNAYGLHQVVYASYSDKYKALKSLRQIKAKNNPYAWLYVKEL